MRVGDVVRARVTSVHEYGVYLEAVGLVGFIQPIELSWKRGVVPPDVAVAGDSIDVCVLAIGAGRFSGSVKAAHPELDPWREADEFDVGTVHEGVVSKALDWGCVVAIRPDVEGVVLGRADVEVGDRLRVAVAVCDRDLRKLELTVRLRHSRG